MSTERRKESLAIWRERFVVEGRSVPAEIEAALRADSRASAKALLAAIEKRRRANRAEGQRLRHMLAYEQTQWSAGLLHVAGVDEAGMSPLAGPVVAAAVILPRGARIPEVDDSKKLDATTRERLAPRIREMAISWAIGVCEVGEIDRLNIYYAGLIAMRRAVLGLAIRPEAMLIDARRLRELDIPQQAIVHGDAKSLSIAAASILAKTSRDARMIDLDSQYPGYGFAKHKGYGVREHRRAIDRLGVTPIHRRSFGPIMRALEGKLIADEIDDASPPAEGLESAASQ